MSQATCADGAFNGLCVLNGFCDRNELPFVQNIQEWLKQLPVLPCLICVGQ